MVKLGRAISETQYSTSPLDAVLQITNYAASNIASRDCNPGIRNPNRISIQQPGIERPAIPGLKNRPRIT